MSADVERTLCRGNGMSSGSDADDAVKSPSFPPMDEVEEMEDALDALLLPLLLNEWDADLGNESLRSKSSSWKELSKSSSEKST